MANIDYNYEIDQLAHIKLLLNCFNADTYIESHHQALLALAHKGSDIEPLDEDLCSQLYMFDPTIENLNSPVICKVFYDICNSNRRYHSSLRFLKYNESQPIFTCYPKLFEKISSHGKIEYLPVRTFRYAGLRMSKDDESFLGFEYGRHYFELPFISENLIEYLLRTYDEFDIHISPHHIYEKETSFEYLQRGVINPLNPKCINRFFLKKGFSGGYYDFSYMNAKFEDNELYCRSFRISQTLLHSKGLDVVVNNRNNDMSMMLEELIGCENSIIGYCVHLDIIDAVGKDLTSLQINHIDLAINVYEGPDKEARQKHYLYEGRKVADASYLTHLVRLEEIPFWSIIEIISMFMKSHCLVMDWIDNQFPEYLQY